MLEALVVAYAGQLDLLAAGWLAAGAQTVILRSAAASSGAIAAHWPAGASMEADAAEPVQVAAPIMGPDGQILGELCLVAPTCAERSADRPAGRAPEGAGGEISEEAAGGVSRIAHFSEWRARLAADAALVGTLAAQMGEIDAVVGELDSVVEALAATEDQLLALYELTKGGADRLDAAQILQVTVQQAGRLLNAVGAFAVYGADSSSAGVVQHPPALVSAAALLELYDRIRTRGHSLLLTREGLANPGASPGAESTGGAALQDWPCGAGTLFVAPLLRAEGGAIAACVGWWLDRPAATLSPDLKLARSIAEQAGAQLEIALLHRKLLAQAKLEAQMELAQQVQLGLLPRRAPKMAGLDLYAESRPALQVGGDFYDFYGCKADPARSVGFAVGDVSGKGMSAALLMAMSRTALRVVTSSLAAQRTPAEMLARANADLYDDFSEVGMMASIFVGQYEAPKRHSSQSGACDASKGRLVYANAGHAPVILCPAGEPARLLEADGPMLGALPQSLASDQAVPFGPGDVLAVLTDGFHEASAANGEFLGIERLLALVEETAPLPAAGIAQRLFGALAQFTGGRAQEDDQTLIVVKAEAD
jgi:sigma-B regulation protein RsbU (phosphoserine phosphatase)